MPVILEHVHAHAHVDNGIHEYKLFCFFPPKSINILPILFTNLVMKLKTQTISKNLIILIRQKVHYKSTFFVFKLTTVLIQYY